MKASPQRNEVEDVSDEPTEPFGTPLPDLDGDALDAELVEPEFEIPEIRFEPPKSRPRARRGTRKARWAHVLLPDEPVTDKVPLAELYPELKPEDLVEVTPEAVQADPEAAATPAPARSRRKRRVRRRSLTGLE